MERVYENSLAIEMQKQGLLVKQQAPVTVYYQGEIVGEYFADIVVENKVILELKTAEKINEAHKVQLLNYLKASHLKIGYILNFGPQPTFKRIIYTKHPNKPRRNP